MGGSGSGRARLRLLCSALLYSSLPSAASHSPPPSPRHPKTPIHSNLSTRLLPPLPANPTSSFSAHSSLTRSLIQRPQPASTLPSATTTFA